MEIPCIERRSLYWDGTLDTFLFWPQKAGPVSIFDRTSYRKISWSLAAARFVFWIVPSFWNLTDTSAAFNRISCIRSMCWAMLKTYIKMSFSANKCIYELIYRIFDINFNIWYKSLNSYTINLTIEKLQNRKWTWYHVIRTPYILI